MRNSIAAKHFFGVIVIVMLTISQTTFSQAKKDRSKNANQLNLSYKFPGDKSVKYMNVLKMVQALDINGDTMLVNVASILGCSIKSNGVSENNLLLDISIDTMATNVDSPQGSSGGPVPDATGKPFGIVISPSGKIIDLTGARNMTFNIEGGGQGNASQSFYNFLPILPEGAVNVGYTWSSSDSIGNKTPTISMKEAIISDNKIDGIELVNGINCARITSVYSGERTMNTQSQGMNINTSGKFTGTSVVLFAIKEGYFLKQSVNDKLTGTIEIADQGMTFPVVINTSSTTESVK
jgi:hypothetical protein